MTETVQVRPLQRTVAGEAASRPLADGRVVTPGPKSTRLDRVQQRGWANACHPSDLEGGSVRRRAR